MADDTGTLDTTPQWTPPPLAGNDPLMAQIQQDQNPQNELQALANNTPPPTPQQAAQMAQQPQFNELENLENARNVLASQPQPDYTPTPRDVSDHMTGIKGVLHNVSSFLAGPTEYKAIVNPDGSMSISQQPSTEKEKWARIAAAAIGGAARGLAAGQGPGGAARAVAAGEQFGQQIPQQQQQQAQQQVDFSNKQLLNTANRIHLQQQGFLTAQTIAQNKINLGKENADMLNRVWEATRTSPNAQDLGTLDPTDPNALPRLAGKNPAAMDAFLGKSNMVLQTMPTPDGKFHLVMTDRSYADSKPTEPMELLSAGTKDGEIALNSTMVPPGSNITRQDIWNANLKAVTQVSTAKKSQADADAKDNPQTKAPTTYESGIIQEELAKTPNDRAGALDRAGKRIEAHERRLGGGGAGGTGGGGGAPNLGVASPETDEQRNAALARLAPGDAATVRAIGEIRNAPPNRSTKEGQRLMGLVNQIYPDYDSTQYPAYLKTKLDYTPAGVSGKGLNFIGTALTHMDRMENNIGALKNVTIPVVGSWWNAAKNAATKGTNPGLAAFMDDQKAVTSEIARAYNGGAITQDERDHMESLIDATDSPATIQSAIGEFRQLLHGKLEQYQQGWDAQMPRHQRNAVLDNLVTRGTDYRPPPPATPTPPSGPTTPQPIRPANVPQGFVHSRTGPRGSGWYKPGTPRITPE